MLLQLDLSDYANESSEGVVYFLIREDDLFINGKRFVKERALLEATKAPLLTLSDYRRDDTGWRNVTRARLLVVQPVSSRR